MRVIKPNNNLKFFGFTEIDVNNLDQILCSNCLSNLIELEDINDQLFDFGSFVNITISSKVFRIALLNACYQELKNFPECILNNMPLVASTLSFKFNLFLLLIDSLNSRSNINPLYLQFLEMHKRVPRYTNTIIDAFFEMCRLGLFNQIDVFNLFAESNNLERSGWVGTCVPTPHKESIAEHMYVMYILANIYLPESYNETNYDKQKILQMIMIHDLAETLTGDIPHPNKTSDDELKEDLTAKALWCNLLYHESSCAKQIYDLWEDWSLNNSINAKIAHDFDAIQLNYQFFTYACKYPNTYSDDDILKWTRRQPKTDLGKSIYKKVILDNPKFKDRIGVINGKY